MLDPRVDELYKIVDELKARVKTLEFWMLNGEELNSHHK